MYTVQVYTLLNLPEIGLRIETLRTRNDGKYGSSVENRTHRIAARDTAAPDSLCACRGFAGFGRLGAAFRGRCELRPAWRRPRSVEALHRPECAHLLSVSTSDMRPRDRLHRRRPYHRQGVL